MPTPPPNINILSYTIYNDSLGIIDTNDSMFGFGLVENSTSYNLYIPNPVSGNTNIGATISTNGAVDEVTIIVAAPALYTEGGNKGASVQLEFYYRKTNGTHSYADPGWGTTKYTPFPIVDKWDTLYASTATKSETVLPVTIKLPDTDYYDIKVVRADGTANQDIPANLAVSNSAYLKEVTEKAYEDLVYPCTALLGIRAKATNQLSGGMPTVTSIVRGIKVKVPTGYVSTYDGAKYCGVRYQATTWDGTMSATPVWTDNPVWCLYDFLTNDRYGLGGDFKILESRRNVMLANFYAMAQYCDEYLTPDGSVTSHDNPYARPRFSLNIVMDTQKSAREWVNVICASMRATLFNCEGIVYLDIDRSKPLTQLFNMSNISSFTQSSVSFKTIPNTVQAQYPNIEKEYQSDSFLIETRELQQNTNIEPVVLNLDMIGVTNDSDAKNLAAYALEKAVTSSTVISFKTGTDLLAASVLDVIGIQHDVPMWGSGGRVTGMDIASGVSVVHLSQPFSYYPTDNGDGSLYGTLSIGLCKDGGAPIFYDCLAISSTGEMSTVSITVSGAYVYDPASSYTYILNYQTDTVKPFKIVSLKRDSDEFVEVSAIEYNYGIYSDSIVNLGYIETSNYSTLELAKKESVKDFRVEKRASVSLTGEFTVGLDMWYSVPSNLTWLGVQVYYGVSGTGVYKYTNVDWTGHIHLPADDMLEGNYDFIAVSLWKEGTSQTKAECLADATNTPYVLNFHVEPYLNNTEFMKGVSGLQMVGQGNAIAFVGRDVTFNWRKPAAADFMLNDLVIDTPLGVMNSNSWLKGYKVSITSSSGNLLRSSMIYTESYTYTYEQNYIDTGGKPVRSFYITVTAIDKLGREATSKYLGVANAAPAKLT